MTYNRLTKEGHESRRTYMHNMRPQQVSSTWYHNLLWFQDIVRMCPLGT